MANLPIRREPVDSVARHGHEQATVGFGCETDHGQPRRRRKGGQRVETVVLCVIDGQPIVGARPDSVGGIADKRMHVANLETRAGCLRDHRCLAIPQPIDERIAGAHKERAVTLLGDRRWDDTVGQRGDGLSAGHRSVSQLLERHDRARYACQERAVAVAVEHPRRWQLRYPQDRAIDCQQATRAGDPDGAIAARLHPLRGERKVEQSVHRRPPVAVTQGMDRGMGGEPECAVGRLDDMPFAGLGRRPLRHRPLGPAAILKEGGALHDFGLGIDEARPDSARAWSDIDDLASELSRIVPPLPADDPAGNAESPQPEVVGAAVDAGVVELERIDAARQTDRHEFAAIAGEYTVRADESGCSLTVEDDVLERPGGRGINRPVAAEGRAGMVAGFALAGGRSFAADDPERSETIEADAQEVADLPMDRGGDGGGDPVEGLSVEPREARSRGTPHAAVRCDVERRQRRLGQAVFYRPPADRKLPGRIELRSGCTRRPRRQGRHGQG